LTEEAASGTWGCATGPSGIGSASLDLKSDDVLSWVPESFGVDDAPSSIGAMICAAFGSNVAFCASDDVAACCGAATFEVGELVSLVVAPASDSASGAGAVALALGSDDGAA